MRRLAIVLAARRLFVLMAAALVLASPSAAEEFHDFFADAFKKRNPNQLAYFVEAAGDCSITESKIVSIVEGVFVRSRIKPDPESWLKDSVYLHVYVACMKTEGSDPVYKIDVFFASVAGKSPVFYSWPFGTFGSGSVDRIQAAVKNAVEEAVTAYLRANFDL